MNCEKCGSSKVVTINVYKKEEFEESFSEMFGHQQELTEIFILTIQCEDCGHIYKECF